MSGFLFLAFIMSVIHFVLEVVGGTFSTLIRSLPCRCIKVEARKVYLLWLYLNKDELPEGFSQKMQEEKQKTRPTFQPPKEDRNPLAANKDAPKEEEKPKPKVCKPPICLRKKTLNQIRLL